MSIEFRHIASFQAFNSGDSVVVLGLGDDGWIYQFNGEEGLWERLSKKFPNTIRLAGSESSDVSISVTQDTLPPASAS